jgi:hypothetical protein
MRRMPMLLLCVAALSAIFLLVGCAGGASQGGQGHTAHPQSANVTLDLHPEGDSGVSGTASFEDTSDGVVVKLDLRDLPKPDTLYLAHIHSGTCAEVVAKEGEVHGHEESGHEQGGSHGGSHGEEGHSQEHGGSSGHEQGGDEIEYPLSQVKSDPEGHGSSTTTLRETSVEELFSGAPKHVNVHEPGSGNPPILACADLKQAG